MIVKFKVFIINCHTGCSCCRDENHSRGFFQTKEDAERRVTRFLDPNLNENPVASQYAKKGRYRIQEYEVESIDSKRIIMGDRVFDFEGFALVNPDGTVKNEQQLWTWY